MKIGHNCPLHCGRWHWGRIVNPFGWALYLGPVYVMRVR